MNSCRCRFGLVKWTIIKKNMFKLSMLSDHIEKYYRCKVITGKNIFRFHKFVYLFHTWALYVLLFMNPILSYLILAVESLLIIFFKAYSVLRIHFLLLRYYKSCMCYQIKLIWGIASICAWPVALTVTLFSINDLEKKFSSA